MKLSPAQYRDLMNEYEHRRQYNLRLEQTRKEEIYARIPEIEELDRQIAQTSLDTIRKIIYHNSDVQKNSAKDKIQELSVKKQELLLQHHYPADYLEPVYECSFCKDTGYVGSDKCFCLEKRIADLLYQQSNLKELLPIQNFSNFNLDYYSREISQGKKVSPQENMRHILDQCKQYITGFNDQYEKNLLICGNTGVGKTFLSVCIANEIIKKGYSVLYLTSHQLFEQLADYKFRRENFDEQSYEALLDCDLLIIDDLGTELNNSFTNSQLFLCINERILHKHSTIINTNLSLKEISLSYTERVFSRLVQSYSILHIFGEDIRIKKAVSSLD